MAYSRERKISSYYSTIGNYDLFKGISPSDLAAVLDCAGATVQEQKLKTIPRI